MPIPLGNAIINMAGTELTEERKYEINGFEGMQAITSRFVKQPTELSYAQNASFDEVGSTSKKLGYTQRGNQLVQSTTTSTSTTSTSSSTSSSSSTSTTTTA